MRNIEQIRASLPFIERRDYVPSPGGPPAIRASTLPGVLLGYAAIYGSLSGDLGGFQETIAKGAFARTLREKPDILALFDHDSSKILGRTTAGTLSLIEDNVGLRVRLQPVDTQLANDVYRLVETRHVCGMSFAFHLAPRGERWFEEGGEVRRELIDLDLHEVSVVCWPAYSVAGISAVGDGGRARLAVGDDDEPVKVTAAALQEPYDVWKRRQDAKLKLLRDEDTKRYVRLKLPLYRNQRQMDETYNAFFVAFERGDRDEVAHLAERFSRLRQENLVLEEKAGAI